MAEPPAIRRMTPADPEAAAALHALCFDAAWDAMAIDRLMTNPVTRGLIAPSADGEPALGLILWHRVADEAEVLTLAVHPDHRRRGLARGLLNAANADWHDSGVTSVFLEVAEDNPAAIRLYRTFGFQDSGRRHAYFRSKGMAVDAICLRFSRFAH